MAWGMEFGGVWGKLALSVFRIVAIIAIGFWLRNLIREKAATVAIVSISLIFAGALGNLIDSAFYGLLFSDSLGRVAEFLPEGGGYAPFLQGSVVDMLYFPLIKGYLPDWVPFKGGDYFIFFRPIFNIADTAISIGVGLLLVFQKKAFQEPVKADA
jgi:signal peptidase II